MLIGSPPRIIRRIFPKSIIWEKPNREKKIYLTFDDGPIPKITPQVLDILDNNNIKATFFMVGENVQKHPEIYKMVVEKGHSIGNHTYNHMKGWGTDNQAYYENIEKAQKLIPSPLFRPPYGRITRKQTIHLLSEYQVVMWSVLSMDYNQKLNPEDIISNVKKEVKEGSIIVFHDNIKAEKNLMPSLEHLIPYFKQKGYIFDKL